MDDITNRTLTWVFAVHVVFILIWFGVTGGF